MVQGGSRSSSEAHLLGNKVNRNFLAALLSEVPVPDTNLRPAPERFSEHFIFQMKQPDTKSGPLLPILLHSKAETRYVHGMGASVCGRQRFQKPIEFPGPLTSPWESRSDARVGSDAAPTEAPPRPMLSVYLR